MYDSTTHAPGFFALQAATSAAGQLQMQLRIKVKELAAGQLRMQFQIEIAQMLRGSCARNCRLKLHRYCSREYIPAKQRAAWAGPGPPGK